MASDGITLTMGASVVSAIAGALVTYWKTRQTTKTASRIEPQPLAVKPEYPAVRRPDCESLMARNESDHKDIFCRLARLEQQGARNEGVLNTIRDDVRDVKNLLMKGPANDPK